MKLTWERYTTSFSAEGSEFEYWVLTRTEGSTTGVSTGYMVGTSRLPYAKVFAGFPNGDFRYFDTEEDAKAYCEVCCRMETHKTDDRRKRYRSA